MKIIGYLGLTLLIVNFLTGCQGKATKVQEKYWMINGTWINSEYKDVAIKTKSANLAAQKFDDVGVCLSFTSSRVPFKFGILFDAHSGVGGVDMSSYSEKDTCFYVGDTDTPFFKLKPLIKDGDTILIMFDNPKLSGVRVFERISNQHVRNPFEFVFNRDIFKGVYNVTDSSGNLLQKNIRLTVEGHIINFSQASIYEVVTDYSMEFEPIDFIYLDGNKKFEYEFQGYDILIYERIPVDEYTTERGKLKYVFVRQEEFDSNK